MTTNTLGFGSLASVAWTDMNGTGLDAAQLTSVNGELGNASVIASTLLDIIKGAVNVGRSAFSLTDVNSDPARGFDYFAQTSLGGAAKDTPVDWAEFILRTTGTNVTATQDWSLNQWRRVAADLQDYAAQEASKRSSANGGGVKNVNGHWFVNGQQLSLLDVYMAVRVNQVSNFDESLQIYIQELNNNNRLVRAANEWLNALRGSKPTDTVAASPLPSTAAFVAKWGFNPVTTFMPNTNPGAGATSKNLKYEQFLDETKSYVDSRDTENQTVQQKLEQMTNRRSEVLEGLTSFAKAQSQTGSSFARNLG